MNELELPNNGDEIAELRARFKFVCRRCGSDDVAVNFEDGHVYSEHTQDSSTLQMGCNACQENDFFAYL